MFDEKKNVEGSFLITKKFRTSPPKWNMSVGVVLLSQFVEKYSLGRTTGISPANWRCRRLVLSETSLAYYQDDAGEKEYLSGSALTQPLSSSSNVRPANDAGLKFQCPLSAVSVLFAEPAPEVHSEVKRASPADRQMMFALRLFDNGVFTLVVRVRSRAVKEEWVNTLWSALSKKSSRVQRVPSLAPPPPPTQSSPSRSVEQGSTQANATIKAVRTDDGGRQGEGNSEPQVTVANGSDSAKPTINGDLL